MSPAAKLHARYLNPVGLESLLRSQLCINFLESAGVLLFIVRE